MAIATEIFEINGTAFVRTYSDSGYYIHGGYPEGDYPEAIDPASLGRTYTETDTLIAESATEAEAEEIVNILTGGAS